MPDTQPHQPPGREAEALSPRRAWSAVIALAVAVFAVTATEMMPIGVLPQITADLGVSDAAGGSTVTVYGVVAGLSAPAMTSWTRRLDRRVLVLVIIGVFVAGNAATALVSSYPALLAVRLGIGLFHGLMWSIIAGVAIRVVPPSSAGRATATVFSGISLALVLGVPAGTALGAWWNWHAVFAVLAAIAALSWVAVVILVPALPAPATGPARSVLRLLTIGGGMRTILGVTALAVIGNYAAYTYIAPFLIECADRQAVDVSVYLLVYGVAGVLGNFLAGALVGRGGSVRVALCTASAVLTVSLVVLRCAPPTTAMVFVTIAVWGMSYSALPVILQTSVFSAAPDARDAATSLYVLVFNTSIAAGAFAGALAIDTFRAAGPILVGAVFCAAAVGVTLYRSSGRITPPDPSPPTKNFERNWI